MTASTQAGQDVLYKMAMESIGFAAQILTPNADQFSALIEANMSMHNSLHITDPTTYIKAINSESLRQQVELCAAALRFILAVQKVKSELQP